MKVRAQIAMVMNLDKCIGCHTCSVVCKNVWTNRKGMEYAWFNNVESKPGIGYPKNWEDQENRNGGWVRTKRGKLKLKSGGKVKRLLSLFANPDMPEIDDYYDPFTFDYGKLQSKPLSEAAPTARPYSQITGKRMEKIHWGPNWEDDMAGEFEKRSADVNFKGMEKQMYSEFQNTFHLYLPRICNHCINPSCVAACPSGSLYKREEDGIVLVDQDKCRGWRMCVSACPYKKIYFNWESGKAEKCTYCYPRIESGLPTLCSHTCVGRIRSQGVIFYDADRIEEAASVKDDKDLYQAQLDIFLDPNDPEVIAAAKENNIPLSWITAAQRSPVYKMAVEWKVAFPLHPEFRTLPMVWYVPPLSPVQSQIEQGTLPTEEDGVLPKSEAMRLPLRYLANMFTAGNEEVIKLGLDRMLAMRVYKRMQHVEGHVNSKVFEKVGLTTDQLEEMHFLMAIANWEDRFVIPTSHKEMHMDNVHEYQGSAGFTAGNNVPNSKFGVSLFPDPRGMENGETQLYTPTPSMARIPMKEEANGGGLFPSLGSLQQEKSHRIEDTILEAHLKKHPPTDQQ
ncbi:MAG: nitrate reductase subunit beta [Moraxellaceae bacterium]|nr:MAG: nitrate reductase subunit beta [Moraxellaceae bacterium]